MLSLKTIAYATTFLATSASLNYVVNTVKTALPGIDMKTLEATSPCLADFAAYASVAGSWAVFGLKIYAAHHTGMGAMSAVATAIDLASGAYALVNNPALVNAVTFVAGMTEHVPSTSAIVAGATEAVNYSLESLTTYNVVNTLALGTTGCNLADLIQLVNLAGFISSEALAAVSTTTNVVGIVDAVSAGVIGVSASDLINGISAVASLVGSLDYQLIDLAI